MLDVLTLVSLGLSSSSTILGGVNLGLNVKNKHAIEDVERALVATNKKFDASINSMTSVIEKNVAVTTATNQKMDALAAHLDNMIRQSQPQPPQPKETINPVELTKLALSLNQQQIDQIMQLSKTLKANTDDNAKEENDIIKALKEMSADLKSEIQKMKK